MTKRNKNITANWINYIDSTQAGNCESGSRAWSQSIAYVIAQEHAHNAADKLAYVDLAKRLARASHQNPIASISLQLCDSIMSDVDSLDSYDYEAACAHECDENCDDECWHECDENCYTRSHMAQAIDTLQGYQEEWSRAYEYASRGSFIRALNIPESLHDIAGNLSVSPYGNCNNMLEDMRAREAYKTRAHVATIPRVDFGNVVTDSYALSSLVFMAKFSRDQFDAFANLFCMSHTPTPSVSLLAFRRNPATVLSFVQDIDTSMATYASENEDTFRLAYATWLTSQIRTTLQEHATNTLYSYDVHLHRNVSTYQLTELFNNVRYNAHNVYNSLSKLVQYALQTSDTVARYVTSVNYFYHVARVLASRLSHYQVSYLTEDNAQQIIGDTYYWREIHHAAWVAYVDAMRARYLELDTPQATSETQDIE